MNARLQADGLIAVDAHLAPKAVGLGSMLAADPGELAGLARRAHDRGHRLYCWIDR